MARWEHAVWKPLPEFDDQPRIRATQHISHVTGSTGPISGTWKYFALSDVGVESHFGVDYGKQHGGNNDIWQAIDTSRSADANYKANLRPDGTGAISVETRGGEHGLWTPWQVDILVSNGAWTHEEHGIPLRVCRDPDDPGYGFHTLFGAPSAWTPTSKTCPGPDRKPQWREEVFPRIVAVAHGRERDPLKEEEFTMLPILLGQTGEDVEYYQRLLNYAGQEIPIDGVYGEQTRAAVLAFYTAAGGTNPAVIDNGRKIDADAAVRLQIALAERFGGGGGGPLPPTIQVTGTFTGTGTVQ